MNSIQTQGACIISNRIMDFMAEVSFYGLHYITVFPETRIVCSIISQIFLKKI